MPETYLMSGKDYSEEAASVADGFIHKNELLVWLNKNALGIKRKKIVIVDDNQDFGNSLKNYLKSYGTEITYYSNSNKAYEECSDWDADIVFLDVDMPDVSGIEIAEKLKSGAKKSGAKK